MRAAGWLMLTTLWAALEGCGGSSASGGNGPEAPSGGAPTVPDTTGAAPAATPTPATSPPATTTTSTSGGGGSTGGSSSGPAGQPAACAGLSPPSAVGMQQHVMRPSGPPVACGAAVGDANGTLAFPTVMTFAEAHGSFGEFVRATGEVLGSYATDEGVRLFQQPDGFASTSTPRYGPPTIRFGRWDSAGKPLADGTWWEGTQTAEAADPNGGVFVAGGVAATYTQSQQGPHQALMVTGGGAPYAVRWGPAPLASTGVVLGAGVDALGRAIVMTDGSGKFGAGAVSAQWFDRDGAALTGEFLLANGFPPLDQGNRLETSPLLGGGVAVRRMASDEPAQPLVVVQSGADAAQPAPGWMTARPGTRLQPLRGGKGYAALPYGAKGVACTQRVEVIAPDGTPCGATDYPIRDGTCDTGDLSLGEDGTLIQPLPLSMETVLETIGAYQSHTCTWRFWPGALR